MSAILDRPVPSHRQTLLSKLVKAAAKAPSLLWNISPFWAAEWVMETRNRKTKLAPPIRNNFMRIPHPTDLTTTSPKFKISF